MIRVYYHHKVHLFYLKEGFYKWATEVNEWTIDPELPGWEKRFTKIFEIEE